VSSGRAEWLVPRHAMAASPRHVMGAPAPPILPDYMASSRNAGALRSVPIKSSAFQCTSRLFDFTRSREASALRLRLWSGLTCTRDVERHSVVAQTLIFASRPMLYCTKGAVETTCRRWNSPAFLPLGCSASLTLGYDPTNALVCRMGFRLDISLS